MPRTATAAALIALLAAPAIAQDASTGTTNVRLDAVDVSGAAKGLFVFYASFLDQHSKPIQVTDPASWEVLFDGEGKRDKGTLEVSLLQNATEGVSVVAVIAAYGPLEGAPFHHGRKGVERLLNGLDQKRDRSGVVTYGASVESSGGALIPGHNEAVEWLGERKVEGLSPQLFEAVDKGLRLFPPNFDTIGPNRALVVVTDGFSEHDEDEKKLKDTILTIQRMAEERNVRINGVGFAIDDASKLQTVKKLTHATGGTYRVADTAQKIETFLDHFKSELLEQHVLKLTTGDFEGEKQTTFKVQVSNGGRDYVSGPRMNTVPKKESHLLTWILAGVGGIVGLLLLGLIGRKVVELVRSGREPDVVEAGPDLRTCQGCGNQISIDWKVCKYCEALPHHGRLVVRTAGAMNGQTFFIKEALTNIGSAAGNDVVLSDPSVSKRHAGIKVQDQRFELADFGSTNGVLVNGQRIQNKQFLKKGDVLSIGVVELEFTLK